LAIPHGRELLAATNREIDVDAVVTNGQRNDSEESGGFET
jgi:hypothetical protein